MAPAGVLATVVGSATHPVGDYEWRSSGGFIGVSDACGWTYG